MSDQPQTGSVFSQSGKVTARNIITGIDLQGDVADSVVKAAVETMRSLATGSVSGAQGVEASGDIVTGLRYLKPEAATREDFVKELEALRQELAPLAAAPETPREIEAAVESIDLALAETQKPEPLKKRIVNGLRDTVEFITDAGKVLDAADKAGPLLAKAIGIATMLYRAAPLLFG